MNLLKKLFGIFPTTGFSLRKTSWNVTDLESSSCVISKLVVEYVGTEKEVEIIEAAIRIAISNKGK